MRKKLFVLAVFGFIIQSPSASAFDFSSLVSKDKGKTEREIITKADYYELKAGLQSLAQKDATKALALAALYESDWKLKDGEIPKNMALAKKYYAIAEQKGFAMATFKLGILAAKEQKNEEALERFAAVAKKNVNISATAATAFAALVLDRYQKDETKLRLATNVLSPYATSRNSLPTSTFVMANVYNALGEEKKSDLLLTQACLAKNTPKEIAGFCFGDDVEIFSRQGKLLEKNCTTCSNKR